jgi:hypothetical protein
MTSHGAGEEGGNSKRIHIVLPSRNLQRMAGMINSKAGWWLMEMSRMQ